MVPSPITILLLLTLSSFAHCRSDELKLENSENPKDHKSDALLEDGINADNQTMGIGEFNFPIILNLNFTGQQNDSRIFKVNCKPANGPIVGRHFSMDMESMEPTPFLERSICEFTVQEAFAIVGFSLLFVSLLFAGLFLCCASGRDETIPVAIIPKSGNGGRCPATGGDLDNSPVNRPFSGQQRFSNGVPF